MSDDRQQTFEALKSLLARYAKHFTVSDRDGHYSLEENIPGYRTQFGAVVRGRAVKLYFYPVHVFKLPWPDALAERRLKSASSVLRFDRITKAELAAVTETVETAWKLIAGRRKANPKRPYHRT